jgi:mxaJ protein
MGPAHRAAPTADPHALRVCADPNNMPFSDRAREGFENRIATILGHDLGLPVTYTWWPQRRGFIRTTLNAGLCDVVVGIVSGDEQVITTAPYYRSTYVFVSRRARDYHIDSFDDPRLPHLRIGIHVIGDDYNSLPPGVALARRGMVHNVVGYSIYGNYAEPSPPSRLIDAVGRGEVDVAVVWGPLAGYYARRSPVPLVITPVSTRFATPGIPFGYAIAVGVRHSDTALRSRLDRALVRERSAIRETLVRYGVPMLASPSAMMSATAPLAVRTCTVTAEERTCS